MNTGYSDRIAHALAFAAKHGGAPARRGENPTWPTQPASVAVILARHGAEEATIVAGVLSSLLNESSPVRRHELSLKIQDKFGLRVAEILSQAVEQRFDARGKERNWEASKLDFLAGLAMADQPALEVAAANEIHLCGSLLTDVRRLGAEYLSSYAPGGRLAVVRWFRELVDALERHPTGPKPAMLMELRALSSRLGDQMEEE
jgi:(p)ppGpp synthase/HD superfamily hydrolase